MLVQKKIYQLKKSLVLRREIGPCLTRELLVFLWEPSRCVWAHASKHSLVTTDTFNSAHTFPSTVAVFREALFQIDNWNNIIIYFYGWLAV